MENIHQHPIGSFYVYEWQNFSKDGLNLYKHQADGSFTTTPTSDDLVVKGQAEPSWTFGWAMAHKLELFELGRTGHSIASLTPLWEVIVLI